MPAGDSLNPRQKRFCHEYLIDLNATAAYKRAGYQVKNDSAAWACASRLLSDAKVADYISELRAEQQRRTGITADRVLQEYARVAFANLTDVVSFNQQGMELRDSEQMSDDVKAAIASVTVTITESEFSTTRKHSVRMHDKLKALDFTANYLGLNDELHKAIAIFRKYNFKPIKNNQGYQMLDELLDAITEGNADATEAE